MIQYEVLGDLIEIKTGTNQTLLHDLVEMFSEQTPKRLDLIDAAIKEKNRDQVARIAHTLRSSCAYLGALEMSLLCADLEKWGRAAQNGSLGQATENMKEAQVYLSALEESYDESIQELKTYLQAILH